MYAGHFACGMALWAARPRTPTWVPFVGIGLLDVLDGVGVAAGIERISPAPEEPLGLSLDFIDWDHSLAMSLAWAAAFAAVMGWRYGRGAAVIGGAAVFSHFLGDVLMHNGDLALWPWADIHLGLWLWHLLPVGSWFIEGAFAAGFAALAVALTAREGVPPRAWSWALLLLAALHVSFFPALAPTRLAGANLDGVALAWTYAALVIPGFLVPAWGFARLVPAPAPRR